MAACSFRRVLMCWLKGREKARCGLCDQLSPVWEPAQIKAQDCSGAALSSSPSTHRSHLSPPHPSAISKQILVWNKTGPWQTANHSEKWNLNSIPVLISKEEAVIVCNTHPLSSELISLITEKLKANNFLCTITSLGGQLPWKSLIPLLLLRVYLHGKGREI